MKATALEKAVLEWIRAREPSIGGLEDADIQGRECTGAGFYAYLAPESAAGWDRPPINGPTIEGPGLEFVGGSILWLSRGRPNCLEVYAHGSHFPEHLDDFELSGSDGNV